MTRRAPVVYRDTTDDERRMIAAICPSRVTYIPGSWDKRFARGLSPDRITEGQADQVRRMVWRYRRQIAKDVVALLPEQPHRTRIQRIEESIAQGATFLEAVQELPL